MIWTDEVFEIIAVEVKGRNPKFPWDVVVVYRAPNEDMRIIKKLRGKFFSLELPIFNRAYRKSRCAKPHSLRGYLCANFSI